MRFLSFRLMIVPYLPKYHPQCISSLSLFVPATYKKLAYFKSPLEAQNVKQLHCEKQLIDHNHCIPVSPGKPFLPNPEAGQNVEETEQSASISSKGLKVATDRHWLTNRLLQDSVECKRKIRILIPYPESAVQAASP